MAVNNSTILARAWLEGTNDYQQRVPNPVIATLEETQRALWAPNASDLRNQFTDFLVKRIGYTIARTKSWESPLAVFKGPRLNFGATIQEIAFAWVKGHTYTDDAQTLLKKYEPDGAVAYHQVNREMKYPITVNDPELRMSVVDQIGLNRIAAGFMTAPVNSDNYDEYRTMLQLLATYEDEYGFFKFGLTAAPTDEETGKEFLTAVRQMVGRFAFPSSLYNASKVDIPVFAKPDELVLITTVDTAAALSVEVLASIFHVEQAEINVRQILVDELPIPGAVALLTTEDFFVVQDYLYETTSFYNPETLGTTYWLHHWEVVSASPFVPAVLFTTNPGTNTPVIKQTVTGMTITGPDAIEQGGTAQLAVNLTGTISPDVPEIAVEPDAALYTVTATVTGGRGEDAVTAAVELSEWDNYVDAFGVLHIGEDVPVGATITVTAKSVYVNPSAATTKYTAAHTLTVTAATTDEAKGE